jgi:hypothetical protein
VEKTETCWLWTGARTKAGYGQITTSRRSAEHKRLYTHRLAWELLRGPIPDGLTIDHLCRVRHCCNPDHLDVVSMSENVRRALAHRWNAGRVTRAQRMLDPIIEERPCKACGTVLIVPIGTGGGRGVWRRQFCDSACNRAYHRHGKRPV